MTPSAVGIIINKVVGNRYIEKRVNIRVEHIRHSKCRKEFLDRVKRNHDLHAEAKAKEGEKREKLIEESKKIVLIEDASLPKATKVRDLSVSSSRVHI